jgi:hypothetical protein
LGIPVVGGHAAMPRGGSDLSRARQLTQLSVPTQQLKLVGSSLSSASADSTGATFAHSIPPWTPVSRIESARLPSVWHRFTFLQLPPWSVGSNLAAAGADWLEVREWCPAVAV